MNHINLRIFSRDESEELTDLLSAVEKNLAGILAYARADEYIPFDLATTFMNRIFPLVGKCDAPIGNLSSTFLAGTIQTLSAVSAYRSSLLASPNDDKAIDAALQILFTHAKLLRSTLTRIESSLSAIQVNELEETLAGGSK